MKLLRSLVIATSGCLIAGCTAGQTATVPATSVNPVTQSNLQFAVGTANINGTAGMNLVAMNRQANGLSSVLVSTPFLTGPFVLPAALAQTTGTSSGQTNAKGPATGEIAGSIAGCGGATCIAGTPPQVSGTALGTGTFYSSTFGVAGGVFGLGIEPSNSANLTAGSVFNPVSYLPYNVPLYGSALFRPWGGPPAYDPSGDGKGTRDGTFGDLTRGIGGVQLGLDVFKGVSVNAGTYNLNVQIPTSNGTAALPTATYALASAKLLPLVAPPTVSVDTSGNITASASLPAGANWAGGYIEIHYTTNGTCNGAGDVTKYGGAFAGNGGLSNPIPDVWYTQWFNGTSGSVSITSKNAPGPPGTTFPAICSGDTIDAYTVGFDYNHYALTYNGPLNSTYPAKPTLPSGGADISISGAGSATAP